MEKILEYRGCKAICGYSEEDRCLLGAFLNLPDHMNASFDGETKKELEKAFHDMADFLYESYEENVDRAPLKPVSDKAVEARTAFYHDRGFTASVSFSFEERCFIGIATREGNERIEFRSTLAHYHEDALERAINDYLGMQGS